METTWFVAAQARLGAAQRNPLDSCKGAITMAQQPMKRLDNPPARSKQSNAPASSSSSAAAWKRADDMTESLGGGMRNLAGTIREKAPAGPMGQVAAGVASTLEQTGNYLEKEGLSGASGDLMQLVRKHPLESLLVSVGVGFLLAQTCSLRR
jgi:hypothetical protein